MKKIFFTLLFSAGIAHAQDKPKQVAVVEADPMPDMVWIAEEPEWVNKDQVMRLVYYPDVAREAQITGKVYAEVLIDSGGRYVRHHIAKSAHPILTSAVEKVLPHVVFRPAIEFSRPVKIWVMIPFEFRIDD